MEQENKKTILIIEDEEPMMAALQDKLGRSGFNLISAKNGEEGLALIEEKKPDLVLLDLMLPKIPGEKILQEMNDNGLIKEIPVIVLTAKGNEANVQNCVEQLGAKEYLVKSDHTLEEIIEKIKMAVA